MEKYPARFWKNFLNMCETEFNKVIVEHSVSGRNNVADIINSLKPEEPVRIVKTFHEAMDEMRSRRDVLFLGEQRGKFIRSCPCSCGVVSCNYSVIDIGINCLYNCSYCFLRTYADFKGMVAYVNVEKARDEVVEFIRGAGGKYRRIGTGEFTDSLVIDPVTGFSEGILDLFSDAPNVCLELKTKSIQGPHLQDRIRGMKNIVLAWSLNSEMVADREEEGCPSVSQRIRVAGDMASSGIPVAFHFDPLVFYPGWEKGYEKTLEHLFETVDASMIRWISLGALRFIPAHRDVMIKDADSRKIFWDEFITGKDGKLRYVKPVRVDMFRTMLSMIKTMTRARFPVYLCMEPKEVWRKVFSK